MPQPSIRMRALRATALLLLLALALGCVKTTATPMETDTTGIEVLYSPPTDRPYREIGLVTTQTGQTIFHDRSAAGMVRKLQVEAQRMGADAIVVRSVNEGTWGLQGGGRAIGLNLHLLARSKKKKPAS